MNENLNLVEILKDCPKGTKLYSTVHGEVKFRGIVENAPYPIIVKANYENFESFTADGKMIVHFDGECTLFPSRTQRNWAEFKPKQPKFDPKTLQHFDKVLVLFNDIWNCDLYSHYSGSHNICVGVRASKVIPYNEDTKHLVGTNEEAPEFYRYWEA